MNKQISNVLDNTLFLTSFLFDSFDFFLLVTPFLSYSSEGFIEIDSMKVLCNVLELKTKLLFYGTSNVQVCFLQGSSSSSSWPFSATSKMVDILKSYNW